MVFVASTAQPHFGASFFSPDHYVNYDLPPPAIYDRPDGAQTFSRVGLPLFRVFELSAALSEMPRIAILDDRDAASPVADKADLVQRLQTLTLSRKPTLPPRRDTRNAQECYRENHTYWLDEVLSMILKWSGHYERDEAQGSLTEDVVRGVYVVDCAKVRLLFASLQ